MNSESIQIPSDSEREAALAEFFATIRTAARESAAAEAEAKPALSRLASAIAGRDNGQALRLRSLLVSLYTGGTVLADVSNVMTLDWSLRKDLCAVLLAFGHGEFGYDYMRAAFERAGDQNAGWFLAAANNPRERLHEALVFAKPGPLDTTPRTSSEKGVAEFLVSLFTGGSANLHFALMGLDDQRRALITELFSDYVARRFDDDDRDAVSEYFAADDPV